MADGNKRNIPIKLGDFSILDTEFSSIRERFDAEMRKMEDEMNKFRHELMSREANFFESSSAQNSLSRPAARPNIDFATSPLIQDDGDSKVLRLRFDVNQYAPEEIVVKTVDQKLMVHAKHEEKSDTKSVYREYNREFLLPKGVNPESIRSSLSKDGVLTVEAPLPAITAGETMIPIAHK
ncbi:PREDICTED: heat shock protein beta-6 isoform X2 [Bactrocera latifrons]|uniref:Heat shock protein beta-1 n=1 Tax=Bactrocera latifrons TaxID=174628 RepID=A0A0K8W030_BACLA|nr:PREDICTED: heat shock protein beta-6 isoform X2 [Bactrocera latifrons]